MPPDSDLIQRLQVSSLSNKPLGTQTDIVIPSQSASRKELTLSGCLQNSVMFVGFLPSIHSQVSERQEKRGGGPGGKEQGENSSKTRRNSLRRDGVTRCCVPETRGICNDKFYALVNQREGAWHRVQHSAP